MIEIEVCERLMDSRLVPKRDKHGDIIVSNSNVEYEESPSYHAQIKGNPNYWACGPSENSAIGDLISCHPGKFGITIIHIGKQGR